MLPSFNLSVICVILVLLTYNLSLYISIALVQCPANTSMADWAKLNDPKVKVDEIARAVKSIIETTALTLHEDSVPVTTSSDCQNASQDMYTGSQSTQPVE